ncbi:MAG: ABC transporter permease, partial [Dehalococcoidia bacterium]
MEPREASIAAEQAIALGKRPSLLGTLVGFARRKPLGAIGAVIVLAMMILAIFAPVLAPYSPEEFIEGGSARLSAPSLRFPLGTDNLGRDMLSRAIWGARLSMLVGFMSTLCGTGI